MPPNPQTQLEQLLSQRLFDASKPPPEVVPVYFIDDVPVSTPGNLSVLAAHIKTGKSAVIGAMMARKGNLTEIYGIKQRRAPIPKGTGPRFRWSHEAGMHVRTNDALIAPAKLEALRNEVEEVFNGQPAMRYSDLKSTVMSVNWKR